MEAMSPQQETLGGQPGRSSSLTGVSRLAGGPGTKKVRTLSGAPRPPPPHSPRAPSAPPPPRASRPPRGFNARGSRPAACVPGRSRPHGGAVSQVTPRPLGSSASSLLALGAAPQPPSPCPSAAGLAARRPLQSGRAGRLWGAACPPSTAPPGPPGAHRQRTGQLRASGPALRKVGGRAAGRSAPHLDAAARVFVGGFWWGGRGSVPALSAALPPRLLVRGVVVRLAGMLGMLTVCNARTRRFGSAWNPAGWGRRAAGRVSGAGPRGRGPAGSPAPGVGVGRRGGAPPEPGGDAGDNL